MEVKLIPESYRQDALQSVGRAQRSSQQIRIPENRERCTGSSMSKLAEIFMNHDGYLSDKWEQYLAIYETEIAPLIDAGAPISILEIGVQNGGSLQVWRKYLPPGSRIVGIDINPDCAKLELDENTRVHIADGTDQAVLDGLLGDQMFDVIVDDGSHRSDHIISTYRALFPRVRGGGKFIIEDLHACYWPEYGGGFRTAGSAMEFLKNLADGLNCDHFRDTGPTPREEVDHLRDFGRSVSRLTFYDSVAVIELMNTPRDTPYRQIFGGGETRVMPLTTLFTVSERAHADTRLANRTAARHIDRVLLGRISELIAKSASTTPPSAPSVDASSSLLTENAALRAELDALRRSTSWRISAPLRAVARMLGRK